MRRRKAISRLAAAAGGAATTSSLLAAPAIAQGRRELKLVTTWPRDLPGLGTGAQRFADRITQGSGGRLRVKLFASGELVPAFDAFDAVSSGVADMYHGAESYWADKSPTFSFFSSVPLGLAANEMKAWVHHGGGQALWDQLSAQFNIKPFLCGNTGVQMAGWFNREINALDDLKNLRMRITHLGGETYRRLGAKPVSLPADEILRSLKEGSLDATEWNGPWNDFALGLQNVARYYYYPGIHEPGTAQSLGINLQLWNELGADDRSLISSAAIAENDVIHAEFQARNGEALKTLINDYRVEVRRLDPAVFRGLALVAREVVASAAENDAFSSTVYRSFSDFREVNGLWTEISDQAYVEARARYL